MAAAMASHFISKSSYGKNGGALDSEPRTFLNRRIPYLRNQTTAYHGLRSQNMVDLLQMRSSAKAASRLSNGASDHANRRPRAVVICGSGMNLIFVGTEVAPWSKTGGLGDVLGGLPPALAVFIRLLLVATRSCFTIHLFVSQETALLISSYRYSWCRFFCRQMDTEL